MLAKAKRDVGSGISGEAGIHAARFALATRRTSSRWPGRRTPGAVIQCLGGGVESGGGVELPVASVLTPSWLNRTALPSLETIVTGPHGSGGDRMVRSTLFGSSGNIGAPAHRSE